MHLHFLPLLQGFLAITVLFALYALAMKLFQETDTKQSNKNQFVGTVKKRSNKWHPSAWIIIGIVIGIALAQWLPLSPIMAQKGIHLFEHLFWIGIAIVAVMFMRKMVLNKN